MRDRLLVKLLKEFFVGFAIEPTRNLFLHRVNPIHIVDCDDHVLNKRQRITESRRADPAPENEVVRIVCSLIELVQFVARGCRARRSPSAQGHL